MFLEKLLFLFRNIVNENIYVISTTFEEKTFARVQENNILDFTLS